MQCSILIKFPFWKIIFVHLDGVLILPEETVAKEMCLS